MTTGLRTGSACKRYAVNLENIFRGVSCISHFKNYYSLAGQNGLGDVWLIVGWPATQNMNSNNSPVAGKAEQEEL